MPGLWGLILLVLAFTGSIDGERIASPQAAAPTAAGPTLAETTDWLQKHLVGVIHTSRTTVVTYRSKKGKEPKEVDRQGTNTYESVSAVSFDGCALTLGQLTRGDDYSDVEISTVPLDQLTGASWKVEKLDPARTQDGGDSTETSVVPASVVVVTLEASSKVISWRRKSTGSVPLQKATMPYEGESSTLQIDSDEEAMPPRLVNAFNHAIQLCHVNVKPEPF